MTKGDRSNLDALIRNALREGYEEFCRKSKRFEQLWLEIRNNLFLQGEDSEKNGTNGSDTKG